MSSFSIVSGLFLTWGVLQSGEGKCPAPPVFSAATYFAERYVVGTKVKYKCENGFLRKAGISNLITCEIQSGLARWTWNKPPGCHAMSELTHGSTEQPSTKNCEGSSNHCQPTTQQITDGLCRVPQPLRHATANVVAYQVGQKLVYRCLAGDEGPFVSTCEDVGGKETWSSFTLRCTHGSNMTEVLRSDTTPVTNEPAKPSPTSGTVLSTPVWVMILVLSRIATGRAC
nr:interleukin-2 receptor subunit alpha-like [Pogona vitticeps]